MRLAALLCVAACGFPQPADVPGDAPVVDADDTPRFTSLVLRAADNPTLLRHDAVGAIDGGAILLRTFGVAGAASFVATFETTPGATVMIGDAVQVSGTTMLPMNPPTPIDVVRGDRRTSYVVTIADREVTTMTGTAPLTGAMSQVVTGDLDGSGTDDYVVLFAPSIGAPQAIPFTTIVSPSSFATMRGTAVTLGANADRIALADLDGDGHLDLVAHSQKGTSAASLAIARGDASAGFTAPVAVTCAAGMDQFALGDLDGDGFPDLVAATTASVVACTNLHTSGAFGFGTAKSIGTEGCVPTSVAIADLDGDGQPEVIVGCQSFNKLVIYSHANSAWTPKNLATLSVSSGPVALATLYDGVAALVIANQSNSFLATHALGDAADVQVPIGGDAKAFALADFDGDGWPDVAVLAPTGPLRLGVPGDPPNFQAAFGGKPGPAAPVGVAVGDFNGDHIPDAVFITASAVQLQLVQ